MDLALQFFLAILPILVIFAGLVFLRQSGTLMGIAGWLLTVIIAIVFFQTSPAIALYASWNGVLSSFGISLMVFLTILQVTMMDVTGAITRITAYIRSIAAERYEQIMILSVGFGSFLVSIGATPVTMLPPIMLALGFSLSLRSLFPASGTIPSLRSRSSQSPSPSRQPFSISMPRRWVSISPSSCRSCRPVLRLGCSGLPTGLKG